METEKTMNVNGIFLMGSTAILLPVLAGVGAVSIAKAIACGVCDTAKKIGTKIIGKTKEANSEEKES